MSRPWVRFLVYVALGYSYQPPYPLPPGSATAALFITNWLQSNVVLTSRWTGPERSMDWAWKVNGHVMTGSNMFVHINGGSLSETDVAFITYFSDLRRNIFQYFLSPLFKIILSYPIADWLLIKMKGQIKDHIAYPPT
uniref:Uncharacterized protein n=1 Tax=Timema bartmani TaxID=61472 RepID=A0A7R9F1E9_9NEOP|nr:unnamed protein product [Timema bartmani]